MTDRAATVPPHVYFITNFNVNEGNLIKFRDLYQKLSGVTDCDGHQINKESLVNAAKQLGIQADSDGYQKILQTCVQYKEISSAAIFVRVACKDTLNMQSPTHSLTTQSALGNAVPEDLMEIRCELIIKCREQLVTDFLQNYLLQTDGTNSNRSDDLPVLNSGSLLAMLIYKRIHSLQKICTPQSARFRLFEPITIKDEFGQWSYDHFQGIFEIELRPYSKETFPNAWRLANDARIYYQLIHSDTRQAQGRSPSDDRQKSTGNEDDENRLLMNDYILLMICLETSTKQSQSELLANLHLIKRFIHYELGSERPLPKIEAACIDKAFVEMQEGGFADDGLFSTMSKFFLPLTISEEELQARGSTVDSSQVRKKGLEDLSEQRRDFEEELNKTTEERTNIEKSIDMLHQNYSEMYKKYSNDRAQVNIESRGTANKLQEIERQWRVYEQKFKELLRTKTDSLKKCASKIADYERQINELTRKIQNIETELRQPARPADKGLVKPDRGFIMYGPPGTGKSEIMMNLSKKLGITMVAPPLAAGELNRSLVGQSEKLIIDLASRCHHLPYAMCCLAIDEIDSLAPKRDGDARQGKVDMISVLLSLIDGIKDVPNLMIFCATNRLHTMDAAFLRRMSGKFFVGRPSSLARTKILEQIPSWALEYDLIDRLVIATTNFSGAACKDLIKRIKTRCITARRKEPNFHVNHHEALEIADCTAKDHQISFGSKTLPRLLLENLTGESRNPIDNISRDVYTGRIIIDLHTGYARIEEVQKNGRISIIEHKLNNNETTVQSLLKRLTVYGKDRNVQLLQLVDLNLLASQDAHDDKKIFETLKERDDECAQYTRSMIIYDFDALVGVNKSESGSSTSRSMSLSVVRSNVNTYVQARFREGKVERHKDNGHEKWTVAIIREPFLLKQFTKDVQFAQTQQEKHEEELERRKAEEPVRCVKCKDFYIENENRMGACIHHDGFVYDFTALDLAQYSPSEAAHLVNRIEFELSNKPDQRERLEREKNKFKWICCGSTMTIGTGAGGCKKGQHINDEQSGDRRHLTQQSIQRWEKECRKNREYQEKWLVLLKNRI